MAKRIAMAFGLGATMPLLCAVWLGGETLAQAGLRLAAIEQGFALASRHWQFEATPAHEMDLASWHESAAAPAPAKKTRVAKR